MTYGLSVFGKIAPYVDPLNFLGVRVKRPIMVHKLIDQIVGQIRTVVDNVRLHY